jgi:hypothetical protein
MHVKARNVVRLLHDGTGPIANICAHVKHHCFPARLDVTQKRYLHFAFAITGRIVGDIESSFIHQ